MAFHKCPRCELNYITDGEKLCSVCRREVKGEPDHAMPELCSECNERPAVPGSEYCLLCLKDMGRRNSPSAQVESEESAVDASALDIDMSTMDEIQIDDLGDDIPPREFDEMESAFGSDDDEDDDMDDEDEDEIVVPSTRRRSRRAMSQDD